MYHESEAFCLPLCELIKIYSEEEKDAFTLLITIICDFPQNWKPRIH